jgi:hypothetical protein
MTIKSFYLVGQDKNVFRQDIHIDQYHDFEALQVAVAEQYNIIQSTGKQTYRIDTNVNSHLTRHRAARFQGR